MKISIYRSLELYALVPVREEAITAAMQRFKSTYSIEHQQDLVTRYEEYFELIEHIKKAKQIKKLRNDI
jgi:hypothetical protein